jgi:hypothetical protein
MGNPEPHDALTSFPLPEIVPLRRSVTERRKFWEHGVGGECWRRDGDVGEVLTDITGLCADSG